MNDEEAGAARACTVVQVSRESTQTVDVIHFSPVSNVVIRSERLRILKVPVSSR